MKIAYVKQLIVKGIVVIFLILLLKINSKYCKGYFPL